MNNTKSKVLFEGGKIFRKADEWLKLMKITEVNKQWMLETLENKAFNCMNPSFVDKTKLNNEIVFNGRSFDGWKSLQREDIKNYKNVEIYPDNVLQIIDKLLKQKVIEEVQEDKRSKITINPLSYTVSKNGKPRILLHTKLNSIMRINSQYLDGINAVVNQIYDYNYQTKLDCASCFHQFGITSESSKLMGFQFNNRVFKYLVLPFGYSGSIIVVQTFLNLLAANMRINGVFCSLFVDDYYMATKEVHQLEKARENFSKLTDKVGLIMEPRKDSGIVCSLQYLGIWIDLKQKVINCNDKMTEIKTIIKTILDKNFINFDKIEQLCDYLEFVSSVCIEGGKMQVHFLRSD